MFCYPVGPMLAGLYLYPAVIDDGYLRFEASAPPLLLLACIEKGRPLVASLFVIRVQSYEDFPVCANKSA